MQVFVDYKHKENLQKKGEDFKNRSKLEMKVMLFRLQKSEVNLQSRLTLTLRMEAAKPTIIQTMLGWPLLQKKAERVSIYH